MRIVQIFIFLCGVLWSSLVFAATSGTVLMDGNGNYGIGTALPAARLQVGAGAKSGSADLSANSVLIKGNLEVDGKIYGDGSGLTNFSGSGWTTATGKVYTTTSTDNVGIGSSAPGSLLDVGGTVQLRGAAAGTGLYVDATGNVGIGSTVPAARLDIYNGNMSMVSTTNANQYGIIYKNGVRLLHDFGANANANNTFVGIASGNLTMGAAATYNTGFGYQTLMALTSGNGNTAVGENAGKAISSGTLNTAVGAEALAKATNNTGDTAVGYMAIGGATGGGTNVAIGSTALYSGGNCNVAIGVNAGRYIADGSTANTASSGSIFLGSDTKAQAAAGANEIVIGAGGVGLGSNTVVLGTTSILTTVLRGNVGVNTSAPLARLAVAGSGTTTGRALEVDNNNAIAQMVVLDNGNMGLGTTAPGMKLDVVGDMRASGNVGIGTAIVDSLGTPRITLTVTSIDVNIQ